MSEDKNRIETITSIWSELEKVIPELDHLVIYLGTGGSDKAIELAAQHVPAEKVTFVSCDCNLSHKEMVIRRTGLANCRRLLCNCGGHDTMETLYKSYMVEGLAVFGQLATA